MDINHGRQFDSFLAFVNLWVHTGGVASYNCNGWLGVKHQVTYWCGSSVKVSAQPALSGTLIHLALTHHFQPIFYLIFFWVCGVGVGEGEGVLKKNMIHNKVYQLRIPVISL